MKNHEKNDLNKFDNGWYDPGSKFKRIIWYLFNRVFFKTYFPYPLRFKVFILKIFGAKIGENIIFKPNVNIKYPWFLEIGNNVWIGEDVWIDNLAKVVISNNVCISQVAYIIIGNHNYKKETFVLIVKEIIIEDEVWFGAKSIICPGVKLETRSILTVGSILTSDTEEYTTYQENPAKPIGKRIING